MDVPSAVLGIVLFETAFGGLAVLVVAPTWGAVRRGYEVLLGGTLGLMALGAWAAMRDPLASIDAASLAVAPDAIALTLALFAGASLVGAAAVLVGARLAGRVLMGAAVAGGLVLLWQLGILRGGGGLDAAVAALELALGAFFLGAVWVGLVLGHWYLTERRLSNRYMVWTSWVTVAAVVAGAVSVALSAANQAPCVGLTGDQALVCRLSYSPILSLGSFTIYMGLGLVALVALIAGLNVKLAREGGRSIQAATGMYYLAVILAPAAEFAAKVRFF
ncbi:MAG: hypothetical protein ACRDUY_04380 [Nitriliruptorales bacterium]